VSRCRFKLARRLVESLVDRQQLLERLPAVRTGSSPAQRVLWADALLRATDCSPTVGDGEAVVFLAVA